MIRVLILTACSLMTTTMTTTAYAELMQCDEARKCRLVCYFPSSSARTDHVYPANRVPVDRVRVDRAGDGNRLYTSQRVGRSGTMPTYNPLESFILPRDYPCRPSPIEQEKELAASGLYAPTSESLGTGVD